VITGVSGGEFGVGGKKLKPTTPPTAEIALTRPTIEGTWGNTYKDGKPIDGYFRGESR